MKQWTCKELHCTKPLRASKTLHVEEDIDKPAFVIENSARLVNPSASMYVQDGVFIHSKTRASNQSSRDLQLQNFHAWMCMTQGSLLHAHGAHRKQDHFADKMIRLQY